MTRRGIRAELSRVGNGADSPSWSRCRWKTARCPDEPGEGEFVALLVDVEGGFEEVAAGLIAAGLVLYIIAFPSDKKTSPKKPESASCPQWHDQAHTGGGSDSRCSSVARLSTLLGMDPWLCVTGLLRFCLYRRKLSHKKDESAQMMNLYPVHRPGWGAMHGARHIERGATLRRRQHERREESFACFSQK